MFLPAKEKKKRGGEGGGKMCFKCMDDMSATFTKTEQRCDSSYQYVFTSKETQKSISDLK